MAESKDETLGEISDLTDDEEIQAPKLGYKKDRKETDKRLKGNRVQSDKQKEAWAKALANREANRIKRAEEKQKIEQEHKKVIEEKTVKKALSIKKKQIMKEAVLDEISDDETPMEVVKQVAARKRSTSTAAPPKVIERIVYRDAPQPKFIFV